ncbi:argonaute-like protein [Trametes maxima]|nr:argonaute-like protein [Trametes maxima]
MPPRAAPSGSSGGRGAPRGRGADRGRGTSRGAGSAGRGRGRGQPSSGPITSASRQTGAFPGLPDSSSHITTVGVKRSAFGTSGRSILVQTNHFEVKIPESIIHHYDVVSSSSGKVLPTRLNMEIIERLQKTIAPQVFTPRAVYDGKKNMFAARQLPFDGQSQEFDVFLIDPPSSGEIARGARPPKVYKVRLTHVATINPQLLQRFLEGRQSHDNDVLTAITALNVVIRMEPSLKYPFNVRSFFTNREQRDIGAGMILWRGYFQSIRPAIGRMLINVDISTGVMYKPGTVLNIALEVMGFATPAQLGEFLTSPRTGPRERVKLQRFLSGVRIRVEIPGGQRPGNLLPRVVKKISDKIPGNAMFVNREGQNMSVEHYFRTTYNYQIRHPRLPCVEVGSGALIPMECCMIFEGQIMRKQVPSDKTKDVVEFATKRPLERLASIREGLGVLAYGQSEYVRQFGLVVQPNAAPVTLQARVLDPPVLQYGQGSRQPTIKPRDGAWNLIDKKFFKPAKISRWCVAVFERQNRFRPDLAQEMVRGLIQALASVGVQVEEHEPVIKWANQDSVAAFLRTIGGECFRKNNNQGGPELIVCVLPEASADLYMRVKHFGDITQGVATQCLRSSKCTRARAQYFANVSLKINVKLGGINTVPEARSVPSLTDPHNPTIVMGADVMHPAPGADGRPSFAALVGNVDSDTAKYIADCRVQTSRQEMINDLEDMATNMIRMYQGYRQGVERKQMADPKRIIFFRDGVSEGQFQHVLDFEVTQLRNACRACNVRPKITVVVVGKRHHVRFFPTNPNDADRSGNCPAGTVVDKHIVHPTEFDFYLQSHGGLLGTSRPAHYSVLLDENGFTPDSLQALSFALCHVYARSTRSVSIPAPVYYADIVCARAKNHYDPDGNMDLEGSGVSLDDQQRQSTLDTFKAGFRPLHSSMRKVMYFS